MPHRWMNQSQPQSLQNAVILLYLNAAFAVFLGLLGGGLYGGIGLLTLLGVGGGYGIANEKKWGYYLALVVAAIPVITDVLVVMNVFDNTHLGFDFVIVAMFHLLLIALLVHPTSRAYQKIWFK